MAFVFVNLEYLSDKDSAALEISRFLDTRENERHFLLIHEPSGTQSFSALVESVTSSSFETKYIKISIGIFEADLYCFLLGVNDIGGKYFLDNRETRIKTIGNNPFLNSILLILEISKGRSSTTTDTDKLSVKINGALTYFSTIDDSELISELRTVLIATEHALKFDELRSCWGTCEEKDELVGISRSVQSAITFSKNLELSGGFPFKEIFRCAEHLQNGKTLYRMLKLPPTSNQEFIFYRKLYVWIASLHLSQAKSISSRMRYSNAAIHHCLRCIESYLIGYLVAAKRVVVNRKNFHVEPNSGKRINGIGMLLELCHFDTSPVSSLALQRNNSELAHGSKRWCSKSAEQAVSITRDYILKIDEKYGEKEFLGHYQKACAADITRLISKFSDLVTEKADKHLV